MKGIIKLAPMNEIDAAAKIAELSDELSRYNREYYIENNPTVSDYDYDQKLSELKQLEQQFPNLADANSPTKRVGGDITDKFETVTHRFPMLSLSNTYSKEEIIEWENRIQKVADGEVFDAAK